MFLSMLSFGLAFLSWEFVEAPFRKSDYFNTKQVFTYTIIGFLTITIFGRAGYYTNGFESRVGAKISESVKRAREKNFNKEWCEEDTRSAFKNSKYCTLVFSQEKIAFIYGDSHAGSLMCEAKEMFGKSGYGLQISATWGCPPVRDSVQYFLDRGKKVVLIYPVPEAGWNVPNHISRFYSKKNDLKFHEEVASTSHQVFKRRNKRTIDAFDNISPNDNLYRVFPEKFFVTRFFKALCYT